MSSRSQRLIDLPRYDGRRCPECDSRAVIDEFVTKGTSRVDTHRVQARILECEGCEHQWASHM